MSNATLIYNLTATDEANTIPAMFLGLNDLVGGLIAIMILVVMWGIAFIAMKSVGIESIVSGLVSSLGATVIAAMFLFFGAIGWTVFSFCMAVTIIFMIAFGTSR